MVEKISNAARPKAGIKIIENLGAFFGERFIGELTGTLQRDYAKQRGSQSAARRDLETLAAAVNYHIKDMVGGVNTLFRPVLPDASPARERWLTRDEAARLVLAAWRKRETRKTSIPASEHAGPTTVVKDRTDQLPSVRTEGCCIQIANSLEIGE